MRRCTVGNIQKTNCEHCYKNPNIAVYRVTTGKTTGWFTVAGTDSTMSMLPRKVDRFRWTLRNISQFDADLEISHSLMHS